MIVNNTPIEKHFLNGHEILVKREDLCCPYPGPAFSKIRGVVAHLQKRPEKYIGVLDTYHSKAGWAVSYVCSQLGKSAVNYWPRYKADPVKGLVRQQQKEAANFGALSVSIPAGRSAILYHQARKHLANNFKDSYLMPNALKLPESISENSMEVVRSANDLPDSATLIISISSGTVAAGIIKGLADTGLLPKYDIILHAGYSRSVEATIRYIENCSGVQLHDRVKIVDEGYNYSDSAPKDLQCPFPTNPFYDAKAWNWLSKPGIIENLPPKPIVFWNIGD